MSSFIDVRGDVHELVSITWTDATAIYSGQMAQRINWKQLIEQYEAGELNEDDDPIGLNPPYVAIAWGPEEPLGSAWGICNASYRMTCDVWYVISTVKADGSAKTNDEMDANLATRCESLKQAFRTSSGRNFTCLAASYDPSDSSNEANEYFLKFNHPMYSGKVTLSLEYSRELTREAP
jgi:hypothetical protein